MALTVAELKRPDVLWASVLGVGFLRPAPGTWGSLAAALVWWFTLSHYSLTIQLLICAGYFLSAWWASERICQRYAVADAPQIVADEVLGMWLALALLSQPDKSWWMAASAVLLFRVLDVAKPSLIGWLDREVKGGLGVMLDDVLAGLVTAGVMFGVATAVANL